MQYTLLSEKLCFRNYFAKYFQGLRKLLYGGRTKWKCEKLKKHWLKRPQAVPQSPINGNLDQNINHSKSHIWNSFFENIILGIQLSSGHHQSFY